jgi:hypothetical protein
MTCKKQYPFGTSYCSVCGRKLVIGELTAKLTSDQKLLEKTPTLAHAPTSPNEAQEHEATSNETHFTNKDIVAGAHKNHKDEKGRVDESIYGYFPVRPTNHAHPHGLNFHGPPRQLVFTSHRLIVVKPVGHMELATALFGVVGTAIEYSRIQDKIGNFETPENILKADKENFAISYSDISRIELTKPGITSPTHILIITDKKTYMFVTLLKRLFDEPMNLIRSVIGNKLSVNG